MRAPEEAEIKDLFGYLKVCAFDSCENVVATNLSHKKYCSSVCREKAKTIKRCPPKTRNCALDSCGREFDVKRKERIRYCSKECRAKSDKIRDANRHRNPPLAERTCRAPDCKNTFIPRHFNHQYCTNNCCKRSCSSRRKAQYQSTRRHLQKAEQGLCIAVRCKNQATDSKYCDDHKLKRDQRTFREDVLRANMERYGVPTCQECKTKSTRRNRLRLDAHHVIPLYAGGANCGISNGILLCSPCHKKRHGRKRPSPQVRWPRFVIVGPSHEPDDARRLLESIHRNERTWTYPFNP